MLDTKTEKAYDLGTTPSSHRHGREQIPILPPSPLDWLLIPTEGFGKQYLDAQNPDGHWGISYYHPKWTSTHYTLLDLRNLEVPSDTLACTSMVRRAKPRISLERSRTQWQVFQAYVPVSLQYVTLIGVSLSSRKGSPTLSERSAGLDTGQCRGAKVWNLEGSLYHGREAGTKPLGHLEDAPDTEETFGSMGHLHLFG
ncbi:MAG: hypothetical protein JEY71_12990 [Sphaerochaeta sp.]|nr:hypothetical protein [Sphaerochaeta sp.]